MAAAPKITRRAVLQTIPVAAVAFPAAVVHTTAPHSDEFMTVAPRRAARVDRLTRALSAALAANSGGRLGIVVRPAGYADEPVTFVDLAMAHDAAYSLSGGLVQAICGHVAAYSALGRASRAADAMRLGRKPTADELARFERTSDQAEAALMGAATLIVVFGDTRRNLGQRTVAERLAQIAFLGAAAIISLLTLH